MRDAIYDKRQPNRPHFIREWADRRGLRQVDIAERLDTEKSVVNRWFHGSTPGREYQLRLSALFMGDDDSAQADPGLIFRHPDDDWLRRFMQNRTVEEVKRMKAILEAAFNDNAA